MKPTQLRHIAAYTGLIASGLFLAANTASAATPLLDFSFNEGSGTNVTDSVSKLSGQLGIYADPANDPVVVADSPSGATSDKAVSLNVGNSTSTGFLVVEDSDNPILALATNEFTIEAWLKLDSSGSRQIQGIGAYGNSYKLGLNSGQIQFTLFGVVDINSGLFFPADDTWHHVAVAWQPGVGATFFLDGSNDTFISETGSMRAFQNNYLTIGSEGVANGNAIEGTIDRFRIHKAALTSDQLDSVADTPKGLLSSTLVAFNFSESAAPFASSGTVARSAKPSNPYIIAPLTPVFTTNTPSGKSGDYALSFISGNLLTVQDPNTVFALDQDNPSFTIQAWIKPGTQPLGNSKSVIFYNNGPGGAISFAMTYARHLMITTLGLADIESVATVPNDGGWHHVAVVHEFGKEMRFYVDGVLSDTIAYTSGVIFTRTDNYFQFAIEVTYNQYVGLIDRFKFSKGTLTADQLDWWPIPGVQPGSPTLTIENTVRVSWPTSPAGYTLQTSTDLGDTKNWANVTNTPFVDTTGYFLVFPSSTSGKAFYRLYKP